MRRLIFLLTVMAAALVLPSGVALAAAGVGSAVAKSSVVGPGESIQKAITPR